MKINKIHLNFKVGKILLSFKITVSTFIYIYSSPIYLLPSYRSFFFLSSIFFVPNIFLLYKTFVLFIIAIICPHSYIFPQVVVAM